jgi:hypothetical protein
MAPVSWHFVVHSFESSCLHVAMLLSWHFT